jgi:hypothetical protein
MESITSQSSSVVQRMESRSKPQRDIGSTSRLDSSTNDICDPQNFTLGLIPRQIADCFAGFTSPTSRFALPVSSTGNYISFTQNLESSDLNLEAAAQDTTGMEIINSSLLRDNSSSQLFPSSSSHSLQARNATTTGVRSAFESNFTWDTVLFAIAV